MNINQLLQLTVDRKASDLHLVVNYPPMLRINGELISIQGAEVVTDNLISGFILSILHPVQKQAFEENLEIDLSFSFEGKFRFRVNIFRDQGHTSVALRLIQQIIPNLESLNVPKAVLKLTDLKQGLILVTGPTGHGKSTTLAAMINKINLEKMVHVVTIEDPIEYLYPQGKALISQRELGVDTKSWANALKSALREDPDVVLIGEMRDLETISAALTIAETGHLVLATLHTNSSGQSVDRIIDVFPSHQQAQVRTQLAASLEAVISQRLVPTIQPGRVLAVEFLLKTPALATLIRDGKTYLIDNLIQTSGELGMVTLEASLLRLVQEGLITMETAQMYSLRPDLLMRMSK